MSRLARRRALPGLIGVAVLASLATIGAADAANVPHFANCTAMHRVYPHGVGLVGAHDHTSGDPVTNFARRPMVYRANKGSDADGDHIACEAH
jgi:tetrahydromethanopterin S-methyltransferase subunit D